MEAMRALKRKLSDVVFRQMMADARATRTGPGGHEGATADSSAAGSHPSTGTSDKSLPGPAISDHTLPAVAIPGKAHRSLDTEGAM
jgi:transposase